MRKRIRVASKADIQPEKLLEAKLEETKIVICCITGRFYAVSGECSHQKRPLARGCIRDGLIQCPFHGAIFDPQTGICLRPPAGCILLKALTTYPLFEADGNLYIELEEANPARER